MAAKGWMTQVAAAAGVAAATGAAQLGLGYGLGVVVWPVTTTGDDSVWLGSLGWATWIAASSTVFGAMIAGWLRGARPAGPLRFALSFFAGVGALLTVALVALPARSAVRVDTAAPQSVAATYALVGILLGMVIAYWAVISKPVATNLIATSAYLWALASIAIVVELTGGRPAATYLTSWQFAPIAEDQRYGTIYWPSALITLAAAFLLGALAAWPAARRGNLGVGTAASGAVGPVLVGAAFLLLAPQLTGALGQLQSAYLIAPYAVLAGLAGSALVVTSAQRRRPATTRAAEAAAATTRTAEGASATSRAAETASATTRASEAAAVPATRRPSAKDNDALAAGDFDLPTTSGDRRARSRASTAGQAPSPELTDRPRGSLFGRRKRSGDEEPTLDSTTPPPAQRKPADADPPARTTSPTGPAVSAGGTAPYKQKPTEQEPAEQKPAERSAGSRPRKSTTAPRTQTAAKPQAEARPQAESKPRKSTVAAPPPSPPIAKINPSGDPDPK